MSVGTRGLVLVGAHLDDENGDNSGSASLFRISTDGKPAQLIAKLLAEDGAAGDQFGFSVAIAGDLIVVGAHRDDTSNGTDSGSAYAYRLNTTTGMPQLLTKLLPEDGAAGNWFGSSVAGGDGLVVVGARYADTQKGVNSGAVYFYRIDPDATILRLLAKLVPEDGAAGDEFGYSVAVGDGGVVLVGAWLDDDKGSNAGSAYCYRINAAGTLELIEKLVADDGAVDDRFGISVAIGAGGLVAVGAYWDDAKGSDSGSSYLYRIGASGTAVEFIAKLVPEDGAPNDRFGFSVAVGGNGLVGVSAYYDDTAKGIDSGSCYIFRVGSTGTTPQLVAKLVAEDGQAGDYFGHSMAIGMDGLVAVGAFRDDDQGADSGSAYAFRPANPD